jgi:hypothetical protein
MIKYPENKLKVYPDKLNWVPYFFLDPKKDKWSILSMKMSGNPGTLGINVGAASFPTGKMMSGGGGYGGIISAPSLDLTNATAASGPTAQHSGNSAMVLAE